MKLDEILRRLRATTRDDRGASLVVVVGLMAVGFIVASTIAAACLFAIGQTTENRQNVQAFAAAEAGRDAIVGQLSTTTPTCASGAPVTGTDPVFRGAIYSSTLATLAAADLDQASLSVATKWTKTCPTNATTYVRLVVEGDGANGGTEKIDSVYTWDAYRQVAEGGGLGFMDAAYTTYGVTYSGDIVVRNGNFTCASGSVINGSVFVLDGKVRVATPVYLFGFYVGDTGSTCTINGDVVASGGVEVPSFSLVSSQLTVAGSISTSGNVVADRPINAKGDIEAKGTISVGGNGALTTGGADVKKPYTQSTETVTYARGDIAAEGAITTRNVLRTTTGEIRSKSTVSVESGGGAYARTAISAVAGITANGSGPSGQNGITLSASAGSVASGAFIEVNSGQLSAAGVAAVSDIRGTGTVQATLGDVRAGGRITSSTIAASAGAVLAVGDVAAGSVSTSTSIRSLGNIRTSGTGTFSATGDIIAQGSIATPGGTIRSTGGKVVAVGDIATTGTSGSTMVGSGTVSAAGDVHAGGAITTGRGTIASTSGSILARLALTSTDTGTFQTDTVSGRSITAGSISLKGPVTGFDVRSASTFESSSTCTLYGSVLAATTARFTLGKSNDSGNPARCIIRGDVKAYAAATSPSTLPANTSTGQTPRTQVWIKGSVQARAWAADSRYRVLPSNNTPNSSAVNTAASATSPSGVAPAAPGTPQGPTGIIAPDPPTPYVFTEPDYQNLHVRTGWVDLGTHTVWNGYTNRYTFTAADCDNAMNVVRNQVQTAGDPVVIDATTCGTRKVRLTGWASLRFDRDAVLLVNNVEVQFIRFTRSGSTPRQFFIIQVDDDLRMQKPSYDATAPAEPQPDCAGRQPIDTLGANWFGLTWDPLVRVMLYAPCGTSWGSGSTNWFQSWSGHLYVANDTATSDVLSRIDCQRMEIPGTIDMPCNVDTIGGSGQQIVSGKRMGTRIYQTEP
ncbi:hypothetical protein [Microbacterium aoyamense]|uniref:hypothetical protein n=1 Tax=Microbacterium aoyamense TaxID=344166 RepID=UPI002004436A|nr:hypothetical protein [Microbacterium aoyamense]